MCSNAHYTYNKLLLFSIVGTTCSAVTHVLKSIHEIEPHSELALHADIFIII